MPRVTITTPRGQSEVLEGFALGLAHGPLELLPVSSSAHVEALPALLGFQVAQWSGAERKELEVALHAGTAAGLLLLLGRQRERWLCGWQGHRGMMAAALVPPAVGGLAFERRIEEHVRGARSLAAGLTIGAVALVAADFKPPQRSGAGATWQDGAWLGIAQACALVPGISRNGATLAAARARRFDRAAASRLSWEVGLPVLLGASGLKAVRLLSSGDWRERGGVLSGAAGGAFGSTVLGVQALGIERRRPLWPWALWRLGLAASIVAVRHNRKP